MYVVTYNDQVLLGPIPWNSRMFMSVIESDTDLKVNILQSDKDSLPLDFGNGIMVRLCHEVRPIINTKIETYDGPFWSFTDDLGTATYTPRNKPIDIVRSELREQVAAERWNKEISGTKATIQGQEVSISTARGVRDNLIQQYSILSESDTVNWKFPEGWITLSKANLKLCVDACNAHVQQAFTWEQSKVDEINNAADLQALDNIVIVEQVQESVREE
jgi:hypothetical protein